MSFWSVVQLRFCAERGALLVKDFPELVEGRSHGKLLFRVGEAKHPGPNFTFLCVNITSLWTRNPSIRDEWQADVNLCRDGRDIVAAQFRENGLHAQGSAPRLTPWLVRQGGVAVAARQEIPLCTDNARTQRWTDATFSREDSRQYLHVKSVHAEAGANTNDRWFGVEHFV